MSCLVAGLADFSLLPKGRCGFAGRLLEHLNSKCVLSGEEYGFEAEIVIWTSNAARYLSGNPLHTAVIQALEWQEVVHTLHGREIENVTVEEEIRASNAKEMLDVIGAQQCCSGSLRKRPGNYFLLL